jgi:predicted transcriptional regulator
MLRRHLATGDGLTVEQCRARWKLTREHEMTAPGYSKRRSGLGTTQDLIGGVHEALLTWTGNNASHVTGLC